jgi:hypothetical protein
VLAYVEAQRGQPLPAVLPPPVPHIAPTPALPVPAQPVPAPPVAGHPGAHPRPAPARLCPSARPSRGGLHPPRDWHEKIHRRPYGLEQTHRAACHDGV